MPPLDNPETHRSQLEEIDLEIVHIVKFLAERPFPGVTAAVRPITVIVGQGHGLPTGMEVDQRSVHQHLSHHEVDQRSVHQHLHQHMHDQRLMQVQVGVDPEAVIQRLQEAERQTQTVINEARSEISNTQRVADQTVHNVVLEARSHISEAQAQAQSTETKAQAYVNELKAKHQKELEEVQRVAQRVHDDYQASQNQLGIANDKIK